MGREDFAANGLGHLVTVYHSDVCQKKEEQQSGGVMATLRQTLAGKVDGVSTRIHGDKETCRLVGSR